MSSGTVISPILDLLFNGGLRLNRQSRVALYLACGPERAVSAVEQHFELAYDPPLPSFEDCL